jgi:hypothetical protein
MADPQSLVAQIESRNQGSKNEESLDSYESPSNPYPQCKRQRSSGPQDKDYVPEEELYEH